MPMFKVWNTLRTVKKSVVANTVEELLMKGKRKLNLDDCQECRVFDESDGTEVDDNECLLEYEKGSVFVLGQEWKQPEGLGDEIKKAELKHEHVGETSAINIKEVVCLSDVAGCSENLMQRYAHDDERDFWYEKDDNEIVEVEENVNVDHFGKDIDDYGQADDVDVVVDDDDDDDDIKNKRSSGETIGVETAEKVVCPETSTTKQKDVKRVREEKHAVDELSRDAKIPKLTSVTQELMTHKYRNAKMKNLKIYSEEEMNTAPSKMERTRRLFWNEKAEQLTTRQETAGQSKSTLIGIIDVAWTLRKTALIDVEARELKDKENVIVRTYDEPPKSKKGTQKKQTIPKNLDRMDAAHAAVERLDKEMEEYRELQKRASSKEKEELKKKFGKSKQLLDGAYTELKRAQDAALKSIRGKRKSLDEFLKSKESQPQSPSTSADVETDIINTDSEV